MSCGRHFVHGNYIRYGADRDSLRTFRSGGTGNLTEKTKITPTGLLIEKTQNLSIALPQTQYAKELRKLNIDDYAMGNNIICGKKLRKTLRQALGSWIWLHQTRPDSGFDITKIATDAVAACTDSTLARNIANLYNKTIRFFATYERKIVYAQPPDDAADPSRKLHSFTQRRLVVFDDAGFGPLAESHSAEGSVTVLAQVTRRGGTTQCHGYLLDRRCAKIQRVCKSPLAPEAHAALTAADQALWFQALLAEIVTGKYDISLISPPTTYPLPDPSGPSPTNQPRSHCLNGAETHLSSDEFRKNANDARLQTNDAISFYGPIMRTQRNYQLRKALFCFDCYYSLIVVHSLSQSYEFNPDHRINMPSW